MAYMSSSLPPLAGLSWVQSLGSDNFVQIQMVFLPTITVIVGVAVLSRGIIDFFLFFFFVGAILFFVTEGPMEIVVHCTRKWGRGSRQSVPDRCHFIGDIVSWGSEFHGLVFSLEVPVFADNSCGTIRWPPGSCRRWWPGTKFYPRRETPST
jgi:hypothetical protein